MWVPVCPQVLAGGYILHIKRVTVNIF